MAATSLFKQTRALPMCTVIQSERALLICAMPRCVCSYVHLSSLCGNSIGPNGKWVCVHFGSLYHWGLWACHSRYDRHWSLPNWHWNNASLWWHLARFGLPGSANLTLVSKRWCMAMGNDVVDATAIACHSKSMATTEPVEMGLDEPFWPLFSAVQAILSTYRITTMHLLLGQDEHGKCLWSTSPSSIQSTFLFLV